MSRYFAVALLSSLVTLPACAGGSHDRVFGSVSVAPGEHADDLSTVNGSIRIADDASARGVNTVNGAIEVGARSKVSSLETVNGGISFHDGAQAEHGLETVNGSVTLGKAAHVAGGVATVNGSILLDSGADVAGRVANVNGGIRLVAAHVGRGIETATGDIDVGANSHVEGGILVKKSNEPLHFGKEKVPRVVIGPAAVVQGTLQFEHPVKLYVSDRATVGDIEGAVAQKFSGDRPPE